MPLKLEDGADLTEEIKEFQTFETARRLQTTL